MYVSDFLTKAYRAANVFSFAETMTAEQGVLGIQYLNDLLVELAEDSLIPNAATVSTQSEEVILPAPVLATAHYLLAVKLAPNAGVPISPELAANATLAESFIVRHSMNPKPVKGGLPREDVGETTASIVNL